MNAIAQLVRAPFLCTDAFADTLPSQAWMPFSSYLIVRVQPRILMSVIVSCWGIALCGMAASKKYAGLYC
jgi:uncharacterized protein (DUF486 family)